MAKNYILEPTELTFDGTGGVIMGTPIPEETLSTIDDSYVFEASDGTILKFWTNDVDLGYTFTENGEPIDDEDPTFYGAIKDISGDTSIYYGKAGTFTVSIYTETEDDGKFTPEKAGLPDMNVNFTYENPTNNGIALITKAVMYDSIQELNDPEADLTDDEKAEILDILYNPGYAPMERLASAIVYIKNTIDPYDIPEEDKANYALDFANDLERIAFAICPDMFAKSGSNDQELLPGDSEAGGTV